MNICFISQNGHSGKLPRTFENCRTEFAWQIALDATHFNFNEWFISKSAEYYDLIVVILPKKLEILDTNKLLTSIRHRAKKITVMQEGPCWYFQDYDYTNQINYINFLSQMDFLLVHNKTDISYHSGIFKRPTYNLQSLMIEDGLNKKTTNEKNFSPMIGGNFCSWYGGVDSYFVARNFNKPIWVPSMGRKIENENLIPDLNHLPYMTWIDWMKVLSDFYVGIHLMRTHAAGTFALNCAYHSIPCIGYKGLDTQEILHPELTIEIGDIDRANKLAIKLRDDKNFYNYCSQESKNNYDKFYTEKVWLQNWNIIYEQIKN